MNKKNNELVIHIILFVFTAGIGNIIYLIIKNNQKPKFYNYNNNVNLANRILDLCPYQPYVNSCTDIQVKNACINCKCKQDAINRAIEICGEPNTKEKIELYARAYGNSTKEYRDKAIYYLNLLLNNQSYSTATYKYYEMLADIYVKEYFFDKALLIYNSLINFNPEDPILYRKKTNTLVKLNKINEALDFLNSVKSGNFYHHYPKYSPSSWFMDTINELITNTLELKEKGYVYKPKNKKRNLALIDIDTGEVIEQ